VLFVAGSASAQVEFVVKGVDDPLRSNILAHVDTVQFGQRSRVSARGAQKLMDKAVANASVALRPYGYYQPKITARLTRDGEREPVIELLVDPGPPVTIARLSLDIQGPGASLRGLLDWRKQWPLVVGQVLDQISWEQQKQAALEIAFAEGYLGADFEVHSLELDLEENTAAVSLLLDTGQRYVFGAIDFGKHVLQPGILEYVPRFDQGEYYSARLMSKFRTDLWKTGYFTDVVVSEAARHDTTPPSVDLALQLETANRNFLQGALGLGTDTGLRLSAQWSRHPMSSRGDRLDIGVGWRELDNEYGIRSTYRVPRRGHSRQYWTIDSIVKFENQDLEFKRSDEAEDFIKIANGNVDEVHVRAGRLKIRNRSAGNRQLFEKWLVQYLNSRRAFEVSDPSARFASLLGDPAFDRLVKGTDNVVSLAIDLDRVSVEGRGFRTEGFRDRAWLYKSVITDSSDTDFWQAYLSTRRSYVVGDRWKFILRAEVGYTDAVVDQVSLNTGGVPLNLSVTRLPNFYRFKAGGSASVRGYGFEQLSNNNVGSNHIATASAEVEFRVLENWSGSIFVDSGNAFNDFSDMKIKTGVGFGIRWYSVAGPIRLDFARAIDFEGKPWRIHFTIGTPLL
jgi:translocation and assembly module TamA